MVQGEGALEERVGGYREGAVDERAEGQKRRRRENEGRGRGGCRGEQ
jgi:hypothetical protein